MYSAPDTLHVSATRISIASHAVFRVGCHCWLVQQCLVVRRITVGQANRGTRKLAIDPALADELQPDESAVVKHVTTRVEAGLGNEVRGRHLVRGGSHSIQPV